MYLFTINTIFIGLATFLVIKLLKFPMVRYANSHRRRLIARLASLVAILVMVPAGYTFYKALQESLFRKQANLFINENIETYKFSGEGRFLDDFTDLEYKGGENSFIELVFMGNETIPDNVIATWNTQKDAYSKLKNVELRIIQGSKNTAGDELKYVSELYESKKAELLSKDEKIKVLEESLGKMGKLAAMQIPFPEISAEARTNYENLSSLGYSYTITTDFNKTDTIPIFEVQWAKTTKKNEIEADTKKLGEWLKLRLKNKQIQIKNISNN